VSTIDAVPPTKEERREALKAVYQQAKGCTNCPQLAATRTTVVFGNGNADADLMFVGEAPGANEDRQGLPFVGQAGKLLDTLLGEIGLTRPDVFVCNVLKCRPPGNRDPHPAEIEACQDYLLRQVELIEPRVICTLGNFATKLLRGDPTGITRLHGREEVRVIGRRAVRLYPIFHPAAALYTPANVEVLRADFARIPALLALDLPPQPEPVEPPAVPVGGEDEPVARAVPEPEQLEPEQEQAEPESERAEPERPHSEADSGDDPDAASDADADEADEAERELEPVAVQLGLF
jgi:uracil-DNA glycosylase